ncbi:MAG: hypothetical protein E6H57_12010 [Betaproteobacteria bacterium]|nr:MAG: hypothetical protein E6H57_12010 [Betaproteobacteria bacterium]
MIVAHFACPEWRPQRSAPFLAATLAAALVVALSWPLALAVRSPESFTTWRAILLQPQANAAENFRHFFSTASWFTWPAWPLALWSAWSLRRRWREARLFVPALSIVAMIVLFVAWGPPQDENLIPLLAPLALLAAHGIFTLRRGALAALDWFGALTFAVFAGLVWLGYIAMLTGLPAPVARNFGRIAPGFVAHLQPLAVLFALALAAAWLYIVFFTPGSPLRSLARWRAAWCCCGAPSPCCGCRGSTTRRATARSRCSSRAKYPPAPSASRSARSAYHRPRRSTTMAASARSHSTW